MLWILLRNYEQKSLALSPPGPQKGSYADCPALPDLVVFLNKYYAHLATYRNPGEP
jgi:hypothetical protein